MDPQTLEALGRESRTKRVLTWIGMLSAGIGLLVLSMYLDTRFPGRPRGGAGWGAIIMCGLLAAWMLAGSGPSRATATRNLLTLVLAVVCAAVGFYWGLGMMFTVILSSMALGVYVERRKRRARKG
jgi:hypothetical protein